MNRGATGPGNKVRKNRKRHMNSNPWNDKGVHAANKIFWSMQEPKETDPQGKKLIRGQLQWLLRINDRFQSNGQNFFGWTWLLRPMYPATILAGCEFNNSQEETWLKRIRSLKARIKSYSSLCIYKRIQLPMELWPSKKRHFFQDTNGGLRATF